MDAYRLALYTLNKGGFETYFAVIDEPDQWVRARRALCAMQREDAATVLDRAIHLYVRHDHDSDYLSEMHLYLLEMGHLDHEFDEYMRGFDVTLRLFAEGAGRDRI